MKSEYVGTLTTSELMTQSRTKSTTCLTWTQTWSMPSRTSATLEDSWVPFVCLFCSVCLVSSSLDSLHITLWLNIRVCASFIMSHAHVEWSSIRLLSIHFIYLLFIIFSFQHFLLFSPTLRSSRQQPCALPRRSRVPRTTRFSSTGYKPKDYFFTERDLRRIQSGVRN